MVEAGPVLRNGWTVFSDGTWRKYSPDWTSNAAFYNPLGFGELIARPLQKRAALVPLSSEQEPASKCPLGPPFSTANRLLGPEYSVRLTRLKDEPC